MRIAVYPGSFDPLTRGHLDIIRRASRIFDLVIVAVLNNASKKHLFSAAERLEMIKAEIKSISRVQAESFSGLLVDYVKKKGARTVIRGLRVVSDIDYEFQLASLNRRLYKDVETVFLMPDEQYMYLASSMVKEAAQLGADLRTFVTPSVERRLKLKLRRRA